MKLFRCFFFLFSLAVCCLFTKAQGGTWIWVKGTDSLNAPAVYGTQGIANAGSTPQGLYEAANWIDHEGNLWIFGGVYQYLNWQGVYGDLWKYEPATNNWTWMKGPGTPAQNSVSGTEGVPSPNNYPGARGWGAISWTDNNDDLWLYGGFGFDAGGNATCGDMWRYHIATNEWTFMGGIDSAEGGIDTAVYGTMLQEAPANYPGGLWEDNSVWTDNNNNLWLFACTGASGSLANNLWKYNLTTNQWAWMKGPQDNNQSGNYGSLGIESPDNLPPARWSYTAWKDECGNFYIWGGLGVIGAGPQEGTENDVWKFKPETNNWTWVAGDASNNCTGNYNQYCTDNGKTGPMCRMENKSAKTLRSSNTFLAFGGASTNWNINGYTLNDLWQFNAVTDDWTWLSGTDNYSDPGNYGTIGIAAPGNLPPSRCGACSWVVHIETICLLTS